MTTPTTFGMLPMALSSRVRDLAPRRSPSWGLGLHACDDALVLVVYAVVEEKFRKSPGSPSKEAARHEDALDNVQRKRGEDSWKGSSTATAWRATPWRGVLGKDNGNKTHQATPSSRAELGLRIFGSEGLIDGVIERYKAFKEEPYVRNAGIKAFIHNAEEVG